MVQAMGHRPRSRSSWNSFNSTSTECNVQTSVWKARMSHLQQHHPPEHFVLRARELRPLQQWHICRGSSGNHWRRFSRKHPHDCHYPLQFSLISSHVHVIYIYFYFPVCIIVVSLLGLITWTWTWTYSSRSVCLSTLILALQATRWPMKNTNGFRTMRTRKLIRRFFWNDCVKRSEKANMHNRAALAYLVLICLLRVPWRPKKLQQRACIDFWMKSTSVASRCQTLRELYTSGRSRVTA